MAKHLKRIDNWDELASSANSISDLIAKTTAKNARQVRRQARRQFGMPTTVLLARCKFGRAQQMLRDGEQPKNVATALGYQDLQSFNHFFVRHAGMGPRQFQAKEIQKK